MIEDDNKLDIEDQDDNEPGVGQDGQLHEHFHVTVDKGVKPLRIDKYLVNCMPRVSRNRIQLAAEAGSLYVNGSVVKQNYKVKPGDYVSVMLTYPPSEFEIVPLEIPINIVYEDDDIIIVNKQPGMVVHPGFGNFQGTLLNALAWHLKDDPKFNVDDPRLGLVHRIDKDTSGLLVIAKNEDSKTHLGKQFFNKTTRRTYNALVWGNITEDEGTVDADMARDPRDRMLFTTFPNGENPLAKHAVTHYKVLERFGYVTLVECRLETGRTHQIRVHMKHIGHTLFADERYGGTEILRGERTSKYRQFVTNCLSICPRQALHAKTLGFVHPRTGLQLDFDSQIPSDMNALIEKWRSYRDGQKNDI